MKTLSFLIVSLLLAGCATRDTLTYDAVSAPAGRPAIQAFFINGLSIAAAETDSCRVSVAIPERSSVGGAGYLKVWLHYENTGTTPILLRPWKCISARMINNKTRGEYRISGAAPKDIMAKIDREEAAATFLTLLNGGLRAGAALASDAPDQKKARWVVHTAAGTVRDIASTQLWYDAVRAGVSSSVFAKNTIFPGESANGYVYLPLRVEDVSLSKVVFRSRDWSIVVEVTAPDRTVPIRFEPAELE